MREHRPNWPNGIGLLAIHVGALLAFLPQFFSWSALAAAAVTTWLTGAFGITLCYHRTLTHRSLRMRKPIEYATAILGTLAFQGSPIDWVATHRVHHAFSDQKGDPHSVERGLTWAHVLWLFRTNPDVPNEAEIRRYTPDLSADPFYHFLRKAHIPMQIALAVVFFFIGGWSWVIWAGFARLVFTYHATWLVNSAAHSSGYRTYKTTDRSSNSWWVALLSWGEGWHNNHHAFPFSARHGMRWYEIDLTWWTIKVMSWVKLVDKVRVPTAAMREKLLIRGQEEVNKRLKIRKTQTQ